MAWLRMGKRSRTVLVRPGSILGLAKLVAVHVWHCQIYDQQVELGVPFQKVKRVLTASRLDCIMTKCSKQGPCDGADGAIVIDHQNSRGRTGILLALATWSFGDVQLTRGARGR